MSRINKWILDDENEVDFEDAEAVNQTDGELNETIVTYDGNTSDVQSWTDFIASFVNGMKIGKFFKNLYAGIQYVLHVGSLVNNCVSDNPELPLAAAQGKVLMDLINESNDEITQLKSDLTELEVSDLTGLGTSIPSGADLNNYTSVGKYYCSNSTIAASLSNCPYTSAGFAFYVLLNASNSYYAQIIIGNGTSLYGRGRYFIRFFASSSSNIGWMEVADQSSIDSIIDLFHVGTAISSGEDLNNYLTAGRYNVANATTAAGITNSPITSAGYALFVIELASSSAVAQLAICNRTTSASLIYLRIINSSATGAWYVLTATEG